MAHLIAKRRQESKERHVRPHPVTGKLETTYDPVPPDACQYGKASFWDGRYGTAPEAFDWYHPYDAISGIIVLGSTVGPFLASMFYNYMSCGKWFGQCDSD